MQKTFVAKASQLSKELERLQAELDNGWRAISSESAIETSVGGFPETKFIVYVLEKEEEIKPE